MVKHRGNVDSRKNQMAETDVRDSVISLEGLQERT